MITSIGDTAAPYHLANRVKSPHSLARKLATLEDLLPPHSAGPGGRPALHRRSENIPNELTEAAVRTIDRLNDRELADGVCPPFVTSMAAATRDCTPSCTATVNASSFRCSSGESIDVKELTTPLYQIERDRRQDPAARDAARRECIALSDQMTQPAGIDELRELGGAPVSPISYGKQRQAHRSEAAQTGNGAGRLRTTAESHEPIQNRQNGVAR